MATIGMLTIGASGGPSSGRAAKRRRGDDNNYGDGGDGDGRGDCRGGSDPALPPEVWAGVMEYVSFETLLSCAATCRSMLRDAIPLLTTLRIEKSSQLHLGVASRFRDVRDIRIQSLLSSSVDHDDEEESRDITIDFESKNGVVPFLSRFPKLERVYFDTKDTESGRIIENCDIAHNYFWEGDEQYPDDGARESMFQFLDSISIWFRFGALPQRLEISGLACPDATNRRGSRNECETCLRACRSWPLNAALSFECEGSSSSNALSGRTFGLDVCLERSQIESIIESRPGGSDSLRSEHRVLRLLGQGRRYRIVAGDGEPFHVVKFTEEQLAEIQRVIRYADLDVKTLSSEKVNTAIKRCFENDRESVLGIQCHLSVFSLNRLRDIGLCITQQEFRRPLIDMVEHARQIASVLIHDNGSSSYEYCDIRADCLRLVSRFMKEIEHDPPIDQIQDIIPRVADYLLDDSTDFAAESVSILKNILVKGTAENKTMIAEAGAIPSFGQLLRASTEGIAIDALTAIKIFVEDANEEHLREVAEADAMHENLVYLLDSNSDFIVNDSLRVLVATEYPELLRHLIRLLQPPVQSSVLVTCSAILRQIFDVANPPVIDSSVPRLVNTMKTTDDHIVQANLAHVLMTLASGPHKRNAALVEETFSSLVDLQDSPCDATAMKAVTMLNAIADKNEVTGTWVSWKKRPELNWGEFHVKGELVDSDEESDVSFEEAEEIDDMRVKLDVMQSVAANNRVKDDDAFGITFGQLTDIPNEIPTLIGMRNNVLGRILQFIDVSEVVLLEGVCRRFHRLSRSSDDFWIRHPGSRGKTRKSALEWRGVRAIREFQESREESDILSVMENETGDRAEAFRTLCADLLSRMIVGPAICFRLRGDSIFYLVELIQGYLLERLAKAKLVAIHSHRTKVQEEDISFVFSKFHSFTSCHSHQELTSTCNIVIKHDGETVWRWPDDDCHDVLPGESGRRIIRRLAYRAGIKEMTNGAFVLAEAEMLHAMGALLADAYESSVAMAKSASYLDEDTAIVYRRPVSSCPPPEMPPDDGDYDDTDEADDPTDILDIFERPPPPFVAPEQLVEDDDHPGETIYTIVPGQIAAAAKLRGITPYNVYGTICFGCKTKWSGWIASSGFTTEKEYEVEESYYYKPYYEDWSDSDSSVSDSSGGVECNSDGDSGTYDEELEANE